MIKETKYAYNPRGRSGHYGIKTRRMSHGSVSGAEVLQAAACSHEEMCWEDSATTAFELRKPHKTLLAEVFLYTQIPTSGPTAFNALRISNTYKYARKVIYPRMKASGCKTFNIYLKINMLISLCHP